MALEAVLLDVDGTLIDSNDAHARAWVDAFREQGHDIPFERVRPLIGKGGDKLLPEVLGVAADSAEGKRADQRRGELFKQRYLPHLQAFPGARALLERLRAEGLRLVVATSAKKDEADALLEVFGGHELIDAKTTSDDAEESKPDADIVQAALKLARAEPARALMLGDTPYDIEAARRAGVGSVALRSGGWDDTALAGALAIYSDARELLDHFAASLFARPSR